MVNLAVTLPEFARESWRLSENFSMIRPVTKAAAAYPSMYPSGRTCQHAGSSSKACKYRESGCSYQYIYENTDRTVFLPRIPPARKPQGSPDLQVPGESQRDGYK